MKFSTKVELCFNRMKEKLRQLSYCCKQDRKKKTVSALLFISLFVLAVILKLMRRNVVF